MVRKVSKQRSRRRYKSPVKRSRRTRRRKSRRKIDSGFSDFVLGGIGMADSRLSLPPDYILTDEMRYIKDIVKITGSLALSNEQSYRYLTDTSFNSIVNRIFTQSGIKTVGLKLFITGLKEIISLKLPLLAITPSNVFINLVLPNNNMISIPNEILKCQQIISLDISHNKIRNIPAVINDISIMYLNLSHNNMYDIPSDLKNFTNLIDLDLSHNFIGSTPDLSTLKNLEVLDLYDNNMNEIPSWLMTLPKLKKIYLGKNHVSKLPIPERLKGIISLESKAIYIPTPKLASERRISVPNVDYSTFSNSSLLHDLRSYLPNLSGIDVDF